MVFWKRSKSRKGSISHQWVKPDEFERRSERDKSRLRDRLKAIMADDSSANAKRLQKRDYYAKNREREKLRARNYRASNIEIVRVRNRECLNRLYRENRDLILARNARYRSAWTEDQKARERERKRKRYAQDPVAYKNRIKKWRESKGPIYRVILSARTRIRQALMEGKTEKTLKYIGCSVNELRAHLEGQFKDGMSWDNYGVHGWHVDHIKPICSASTNEELITLLHWSNLQPLWSAENWSKGGRI